MSGVQPPDHRSEVRELRTESSVAEQIPSEGPLLHEGISFYSLFIWLISFSFLSSSFSDWKAKENLVEKLSHDFMAPFETRNEWSRLALKSHLENLSLEQLQSLDKLFDDHSTVVTFLVIDTAENNPQDLLRVLTKLATEEGKKQIAEIETAALKDVAIPLENPLQETGVTNGKTDSGYDYELRTLNEREAEIYLFQPGTKDARRMIVAAEESEFFDLELGLQDPKSSKKFSKVGPQVEKLFQVESIKEVQNDADFIKGIKEGNIYVYVGQPTLFPSTPSIHHSGTIESIEKPIVYIGLDKIPCEIQSRTVLIDHKKYSEITIMAEYQGKQLRHLTRTPYQVNIRKNELLLSRALLLASAAFTREMVP